MAYRVNVRAIAGDAVLRQLQQFRAEMPEFLGGLVRDSVDEIQKQAVQNLSGVPFESRTGTHTIHKRTGKAAASVQYQYPYGSPFRARLFASAKTRYADNPEEYDYLSILEYGRGEIKPKYTPSMRNGMPQRAALTIPGGSMQFSQGQHGFRGVSGRYRFVKRIPPMEGKYWMESAVQTVAPDLEQMFSDRLDAWLKEKGL